jgi:hypothetical protein
MFFRSIQFYFSVLLSVMMCGCGVGSLYGPAYYSETKLGENVRRVTFRGGNHPMTGDLCLLRCAEVTLESGHTHFQVVDSESGSNIDQIGSVYPFERHYHMDSPFIREVTSVTKTIRLLKTDTEVGFSYSATEVRLSMREKYEIK